MKANLIGALCFCLFAVLMGMVYGEVQKRNGEDRLALSIECAKTNFLLSIPERRLPISNGLPGQVLSIGKCPDGHFVVTWKYPR